MAAAGTVTAELWLLEVDENDDGNGGLRLLSAEERRRAGAFRRAEDASRFVAAHAALRRLLAERTGQRPEQVRIGQLPCPRCGQAHGRPALEGEWGQRLQFSLSHGGRLAMIGLSEETIGVDVEPCPDWPGALVERALHPRERAELEAIPGDHRRSAFTRLWVRKEAYLKGLGIGLGRDLSLDYLGESWPEGRPPGWSVGNVDAPAGYAAAYAVQGAGAVVRVSRQLVTAAG